MPEGPEIRLAADELAEALAGYAVTKIFFAFNHLKFCETLLTGLKVNSVEAKGKAMLIRFAGGYNIYSHNQLYGQWLVRPLYDGYPKTNRQLRLAIHTVRKSALLYSASDIALLMDSDLDSHPFLSKLGPDLLDDSVTVEHVIARFMHKNFYRRRLTSLLLDQHFLAGMGNYLRSEVLFAAQIHPSLRPVDCAPCQIRRLAETALKLTRQSYQTRGITNNLALVEKLRRHGLNRDQYRFTVFKRDDEPCYVCGTPVIKDNIGGRRLYFCSTCQLRQE